MKRFLALFLSLALSLASTGVANAAEEVSYTYKIIDDKAIIVDVDKNISGDFVIPSSFDGYAIGGFADSVFANCYELTGITIPEGVTEIVYAMFEGCYNLENINLPDSITTISEGAFYNCSSLSSLELSKNVSEVGFKAIYGCGSLERITVDEENANFSSDENGVLFNKDKTHLCIFPDNNSLTEYVVPDTVTNIFSDAFFYCKNLKKLTIGKNVVSIGWSNFYSQNVTIYGYMDSYAEEYALENDIPFVAMDCGDINSDTAINNKDLGLLMQYLNNWDVAINVNAADVNYDESVNNKDYGLLMQYLNNWDVVLGKQPEKIPDDGNDNDNNDDNNDNNNDNDSGVVNPEDYRGRTVKFITTIDPKYDESGPVVENFEKEYGINVEIIPSGLEEHAQKCMGLIAAGMSPDVARSNGDFPVCLGYLQSLDAAKLDYNDEIWDQNMFEMTTFNGSPYLCNTVGNIWAEADFVMYSKSMLKRANVYTPDEYDAMGKWTWDAFFEIGKVCQKLNDKPGCAINSYESFFHAAGGTVYKLENGRFTNGIDSKSASIMQKYAQAKNDNVLLTGKSATAALMEGDIGITTLHAWSLKKTGDLRNANWLDLGFYYLPYKDEASAAAKERPITGYLRGWGICKGANQPVAAGLFLREYLDVYNYDVNGTFITPAASTFFFRLTSIDYSLYNPYFTYLDFSSYVTGVKENKEIYYPMSGDPTQVETSMADVIANVDKGVKNMNDFIAMNTNWW